MSMTLWDSGLMKTERLSPYGGSAGRGGAVAPLGSRGRASRDVGGWARIDCMSVSTGSPRRLVRWGIGFMTCVERGTNHGLTEERDRRWSPEAGA